MNREDDFARAVARQLLERREPDVARAFAPEVEVPTTSPKIDAGAARRHLENLSVLLQVFTLRGRDVARRDAEAVRAQMPGSPEDEALRDLLLGLHRMMLEHPIATRSLHASLAAEGRRFAGTEEGAAMRDALRGSRVVRRGALLWATITSGLLDDREPSALPSAYFDALVEASERADLETFLGSLRPEER